ncbi:MAG TPA: CBS domain-containing protein, partial [Flavobacteriaceae bacterium]|nr:CBS domain-containing protein [Flavobacteriaceae bacterium]
MYTARDILREKGAQVFTTSPDATVYDALKLMDEKNIGALVVFENEKMVGIISERDYARKMILKGKHSQETPVRDVMTTSLITVEPHRDLKECMEL